MTVNSHHNERDLSPEEILKHWRESESTDGAAVILDVHPRTMENWRRARKGPAYVLVAGRIRYLKPDLASWLAHQRRGSPDQSHHLMQHASYEPRCPPVGSDFADLLNGDEL